MLYNTYYIRAPDARGAHTLRDGHARDELGPRVKSRNPHQRGRADSARAFLALTGLAGLFADASSLAGACLPLGA